MSRKLLDLNADLRQLRHEGFNVAIVGANLVVRDIPYVNEKRQVLYDGVLVASLTTNGDIVNKPDDHTIRFSGEYPCTSEGKPLEGIRAGSEVVRVSEKLIVQHRFSAKPQGGNYPDFYKKVTAYAAILSGHAAVLDRDATPRTRRVVEPEAEDDSPFQYLDTASARAEINMVTQKLAVEKIAIVGLGGTGSYVLDFIAKTPVKEIHLFDGDTFSSHNAFRAPGGASKDDLHKQPLKVDYFKEIYSRMHKGIVAHGEDVDANNVEQLRGMACVFVCADAGPGKKFIIEKLEEFGVLFIDTGMGLYCNKETLGGSLQVTTSTPDNRAGARKRISFAGGDEKNEYDKNIQIADLNALNALFAVIRWKKMRCFYFDLKRERFSILTIGSNMLLNEDIHEPS